MSNTPDGWAFSDSGSLPWKTMGEGMAMKALGAAYAAQAGTTHDDFRTETGCTLVSVFEIPG